MAAAPDAIETVDLLIRANRRDEALDGLRRIVDRRPSDLEAALRLAQQLLELSRREEPIRARDDVVPDLAAQARRTMQGLPREQAAAAARVLLAIEQESSRRSTDARLPQLENFVEEWRGTTASLLTEVDLVAADRVSPQKLAAFAAFARSHPGTVAAAKAQYLRGYALAHPGRELGQVPDADPLEYFQRVQDVVNDLGSGRYPRCDWVDNASQLILDFIADQASYSSETIRVMGAAYESIARSLLVSEPPTPTGWRAMDVVARKLAVLYAVRGSAVLGVERLVAEWSETPSLREPAQYLLANYYLDRAEQVRYETDTATRANFVDLLAHARRTLAKLSEAGSGLYPQRALATLAALEQKEHANAAVVASLREYVVKYPNSRWLWIAALRLGKAYEATNNWQAASRAYLDGAARAPSAVGRALGAAFAGDAYEAMNRFDDALGQYRRALDEWDGDSGASYSLYLTRPPPPDRLPGGVLDETLVDRTAVSRHVDELARALRATGGTLLAKGRWQLAHRQPDAAIETLRRARREYPRSAIASETRAVLHRAQVDRALERGDLTSLEPLAREPYDEWIAASKIARAAAAWRAGDTEQGESLMREALDDWWREQNARAPATATAMDNDLAAIRNLVFRPRRNGLSAGPASELQGLSPPEITSYLVVDPDVRVKLATGVEMHVIVRQPIPDHPNVLFLDAEMLAFLDRLLAKVGGTETRRPTSLMEVPNQPVGGSMVVLDLLQRFFPAYPGHWSGWVLTSSPAISMVEVFDSARTRAAVQVTTGYSGATIVLEKKDGAWTVKQVTNRWIT